MCEFLVFLCFLDDDLNVLFSIVSFRFFFLFLCVFVVVVAFNYFLCFLCYKTGVLSYFVIINLIKEWVESKIFKLGLCSVINFFRHREQTRIFSRSYRPFCKVIPSCIW